MIYNDSIDSILTPNIIKLASNLFAVNFNLMKLIPAKYIIDEALRTGELTKNMTVIETSSGTFALGLALVCSKYKLDLIIIGDSAIDYKLKRKLELLGAKVEILSPSKGVGIQKKRLERLHEIRREFSNTFWTKQYDNPDNPNSYDLVANHIEKYFDKVDCLIGPIGSGGSMCGIGSYLRNKNESLKMIGIDTHGSVLFGQKDFPRALRGLGNSCYPKNLRQNLFDEVHWLNAKDAYHSSNELYKDKQAFMGATSGAAYLVGKWWAKNNPDKTGIILFPDEGHRYEETIFNEKWLRENKLYTNVVSQKPIRVTHPIECNKDDWSYINWNKRKLEDLKTSLK